ncbi:MAG: AI-2E family transporter [Lachnospiraceae bacterium]|nr:AI-2E family transporter [Lachnospiraceae bacterium]
MKIKLNNKYVKWGLTAFAVIAGSIFFYYLVFHISELIQNIKNLINVIMPVVLGLIISYLMTPVLNSIEKGVLNPLCDKFKIKQSLRRQKWVRAIAVILTSLIFFFSIYAIIAMLISQIVPSIKTIVGNFDGYIINISNWLNTLLEDNEELRNFILPQVSRLFGEVENWLQDTATLLDKSSALLKTVSLSILGFLKVAWNFILGFIIAVYVLFSKEKFAAQGKKTIYALFNTHDANTVLKSMRFVHRTFSGFISGKVLDSIIIGLLCFIGTTMLGTPYAALVSVIVGVTNVIPFFGPYLGAIPSAFLILIVDLAHPMHCVTFLIFILILQQLDGNVIGPKILGDSTGLSSFWVIFAITVFGGLFGVLGMVVGVPIFAIFYAAVKALVNRSLNKKKLPLDTGLYHEVDYVDEQGNFFEIEEVKNTTDSKTTKKKTLRFIKLKKNTEKAEVSQKEEPSKSEKTENDNC